jgi:hypothetical protein
LSFWFQRAWRPHTTATTLSFWCQIHVHLSSVHPRPVLCCSRIRFFAQECNRRANVLQPVHNHHATVRVLRVMVVVRWWMVEGGVVVSQVVVDGGGGWWWWMVVVGCDCGWWW